MLASASAEVLWFAMRRYAWALWLLPWLALALLASVNTLTYWRLSGLQYPAWRAFAAQAPGWLVLGLLAPGVLWLGRRWPLERDTLVRYLPVHLAGAFVVAASFALVMTVAGLLFSPVSTNFTAARVWFNWLMSGSAPAALSYFCVLGVGYAIEYARHVREGELRAARLAGQLAEARLATLQSQIQPHFLFNSLNSIAVLMRDGDTRAGTRMLDLLSGVLRRVLRSDARREITLGEELDVLRRYLEIEQVRFSDRLQVHMTVDEELLETAVPNFLLQPLVENALRHGVFRSASAGRVDISARRVDGQVELRVMDDGPGLPADCEWGLGLSNTAARLATLHGESASLAVSSNHDGGTTATVRLPFRRLLNGETGETDARD